jgi:hypothetical protein
MSSITKAMKMKIFKLASISMPLSPVEIYSTKWAPDRLIDLRNSTKMLGIHDKDGPVISEDDLKKIEIAFCAMWAIQMWKHEDLEGMKKRSGGRMSMRPTSPLLLVLLEDQALNKPCWCNKLKIIIWNFAYRSRRKPWKFGVFIGYLMTLECTASVYRAFRCISPWFLALVDHVGITGNSDSMGGYGFILSSLTPRDGAH